VAEVALNGFDPVELVALMQHPLAAFGLQKADARRRARVLEIGALRGPAPGAGSAGLIAAIVQAEDEAFDRLARSPLARRRIAANDWAEAHDFATRIAAALRPLEDLADRRGTVDLADILDAHITAIEAAAAENPGEDGAASAGAFSGEAGEALALRLADLLAAARAPELRLSLRPDEYPGFLAAILGDAPVRRRGGLEARLHIWGPLEARLQSVDRLVLGGLNEGTWPNTARSDPWLSRPMRSDMALEQPERRIGLAAHDVAQGMAHPHVILSRSAKSGTSPTVASRWLQRLTTVAGDDVAKEMTARGDRFLALARALDRSEAGPPRPVARPKPTPPVAARPTQLSVTQIETWIRDPYALYAQRILRLEPLEPIGASPDGRDRGTLIHDALAAFIGEGWNGSASPAAVARLRQLAEERLADYAAFPEVVALWRPRMQRIIDWFIRIEAERTHEIQARKPEVIGHLDIPVAGEIFRLDARADRIDAMADGSLALVDYKTGAPPSKKQVASLLAPQLPLEAAMVLRQGFGEDFARRPISELTYYRLSGAGDGGSVSTVATDPAGADDPTPADLAEASYERLVRLIGAYRNPATPYPSRPRIMFEALTRGDYDHLARVKEWSAGEGEDE
jgi:ATP-dependent helicase/nuclease subunit B